MRILLRTLLFLTLAGSMTGAWSAAPPSATDLGLIPAPASLRLETGVLPAGGGFAPVPGPFPEASVALVRDFADLLVAGATDLPKVVVRFERDAGLRGEAYTLRAGADGLVVRAGEAVGAYRATRTVLQLATLPDASGRRVVARRRIPFLAIEDAPRFPWRGLMLDSSRHFQTPDEIRRWIDRLALHKLNVFHWHLVDSHGWRLEIRKYPKLTQVAAWREQPPIGRYGGWYTQEEVRGIVAYAAARHIVVVPEIELPGHSQAAVAAYPELLACDPSQQGATAWFHGFPHPRQEFPAVPGADVVCASKESAFRFYRDVLEETMELFPSPWIHVGGDEVDASVWRKCPDCSDLARHGVKDHHELQARFLRRIEGVLSARGRRLIGWDEILEGGLPPTAAVMSWRGISGGLAASKAGHPVVMSPEKPLYLDHGQGDSGFEPPHWPGRETLREVHAFEPVPPVLTGDLAANVLGLQGNLWTIFAMNEPLRIVQAFPRLCAIAEVGWSPKGRPGFEDFERRLAVHRARLSARGEVGWVEPATVGIGTWKPDSALSGRGTILRFPVPPASVKSGPATVVLRYRGGADALSIRAVALFAGGRVVAEDRHAGLTGSADKANAYRFDVPKGIDSRRVEVRVEAFVAPWSGGGKGDSRGDVAWVSGVPEVVVAEPDVAPPLHGATTPVEQDRDRAIYDWKARHAWVKRVGPSMRPEVVVIGDSIVHYWGGSPVAPIVRNEAAWRRAFGDRALNLGFGWDRTENVLRRIEDGELDGLDPKVVVVAIGTNNLSVWSEKETVDGIDAVARAVNARLPRAQVLVLGILPRADAARLPVRLERVNFALQTRLHPRPWVDVVDMGNSLLDGRGELRREWFSDGLHPNAEGYERIADRIGPLVRDRLAREDVAGR